MIVIIKSPVELKAESDLERWLDPSFGKYAPKNTQEPADVSPQIDISDGVNWTPAAVSFVIPITAAVPTVAPLNGKGTGLAVILS